MAERTLRRLLEHDESSANLYRLACTLDQCGRPDEAVTLFKRIVERYTAGTQGERLDVVGAYIHLVQADPCGDHSLDLQAARKVLSDCLASNPEDDKSLFLYAQFLRLGSKMAVEPIPERPTDPLEILDEISTRNPNNGRYWEAFVGCATDWLEASNVTNDCPATIESALTKSDIMLWRFLARPGTVTSALALKRAYSRRFRFSDPQRAGFFSHVSVDVLTRALLNQPELSKDDQSDLIAFSLETLENMPDFSPPRPRHRVSRLRRIEEIKKFLDHHQLRRNDEFIKRIQALEEGLLSVAPGCRLRQLKGMRWLCP